MRFSISRSILNLLIIGCISIFIFVSCDELEPVNPADPAFTLKAPTLVSVHAVTDIQIDLTWQNNEEQTEEFVIQRKSGSGSYFVIAIVPKNTLVFSDTNCALGTEYNYVIQSKVESNLSANSNTLKDVTTFPAPGNLIGIPTDESVRLTWEDNTNFESGFIIERDNSSGFVLVDTVHIDVTEYTDDGLTFNQSYSYRVASITSSNTSSWTVISTSTQFPAPSDLQAAAISPSEIELTWTDNCSFEMGYTIQRDDGGGFMEIATVSANVVEYIDHGRSYGDSYAYQVTGFSTENISSGISTVITLELSPPANLLAHSLSDSEIELIWEDNSRFELGFRIEAEFGGGFEQIALVGADVTEYVHSGLNLGQSYTYRVLTYSNGHYSSYSNEVTENAIAPCVDIDGNIYNTVKIGDQIWMAENMKVTHYSNGNPIPNVVDSGEWGDTNSGAYSLYNNDSSNIDMYGLLYNYYSLVAPIGWHVPSRDDWGELISFLADNGYNGTEGTALKSTYGWTSDGNGNDVYGFSAFPGGKRSESGNYLHSGAYAYFWSSTEDFLSLDRVWNVDLNYSREDIYLDSKKRRTGLSIRCVRY